MNQPAGPDPLPPDTAPDALPRVFAIGDSITVQYLPFLREMCEGRVRIGSREGEQEALKALDIPQGANGGDSSMVRPFVEQLCGREAFAPDLVMLNCGLHDIRRQPTPDGTIHIPLETYRDHLAAVFDALARRKLNTLWVRSTAVVDAVHNRTGMAFHRFAADLEAYNRAADEAAAARGVPVADLYGFTRAFGDEAFCDHVHYHPGIRRLQAAYLCGRIEGCLHAGAPSTGAAR